MILQTEITINTAADKIWQILTDFNNYKNWNPFIYEASGKLEVGNTLSIQLQQTQFSPLVQIVQENQYFSWKGKLFIAGLFDGYHYFKIEPISENTCRVTQGEKFSGILVPFLRSKLQSVTKNGFIAMNEALKSQAENL